MRLLRLGYLNYNLKLTIEIMKILRVLIFADFAD